MKKKNNLIDRDLYKTKRIKKETKIMDYYEKREVLMDRMLRVMRRCPYNANRNSIDKITQKIKDLDKAYARG